MENSHIACSLTNDEFRARRKLARETILPQVINYKCIPNGLEIFFQNSPDTIRNVEEFITLEQKCCGFLNFELSPSTKPSNKFLALKITGPNGASKFIDIFVQLMEGDTHVDSAA